MQLKRLGLNSTLTWGKYGGETVKKAIDKDVGYVRILVEDVTWFELDSLAWKYYQDKLEILEKEWILQKQ